MSAGFLRFSKPVYIIKFIQTKTGRRSVYFYPNSIPVVLSSNIQKNKVITEPTVLIATSSAAKSPSPPIDAAIGNEEVAIGVAKIEKNTNLSTGEKPKSNDSGKERAGKRMSFAASVGTIYFKSFTTDFIFSCVPRIIHASGVTIDEIAPIGFSIGAGKCR